jgi:NAD(P)-dependent dehydrogenase (short-subunit alcohol dehydrogenase family)
MKRVLVFGATGFLGDEICQLLEKSAWKVTRFGYRTSRDEVFSTTTTGWASDLEANGPFDAIVWAQGMNASGTILSTTKEGLQEVLEANLFYIFDTLKSLFASSLLARESRGVVISSIWVLLHSFQISFERSSWIGYNRFGC